MSDAFIGEIRIFAGTFAPVDWAFCSGQLLSIGSYPALYSLIGDAYGGDGRTTFGLPDLRSRIPLGSSNMGTVPGLSPVNRGMKVGYEEVVLTESELPPHTHDLMGTNDPGTKASPSGAVLANTGGFDNEYNDSPSSLVAMNGNAIHSTGNGLPHTNIQPSIGVNFIICLNGVYPSRN